MLPGGGYLIFGLEGGSFVMQGGVVRISMVWHFHMNCSPMYSCPQKVWKHGPGHMIDGGLSHT